MTTPLAAHLGRGRQVAGPARPAGWRTAGQESQTPAFRPRPAPCPVPRMLTFPCGNCPPPRLQRGCSSTRSSANLTELDSRGSVTTASRLLGGGGFRLPARLLSGTQRPQGAPVGVQPTFRSVPCGRTFVYIESRINSPRSRRKHSPRIVSTPRICRPHREHVPRREWFLTADASPTAWPRASRSVPLGRRWSTQTRLPPHPPFRVSG